MKILVATDFSKPALQALHSAVRLAATVGDQVVVVHVIEPPAVVYPELGASTAASMDDELRRATEIEMRKLIATLGADGPRAEARILSGRPVQTLCELAEDPAVRLLVLGTQGRGAMARALMGSVAERTVHDAGKPVLVVREDHNPFDDWATRRRPLRIAVGVDAGAASTTALEWLRGLQASGPCEFVLLHEYWPPAAYARLGLMGSRDLFVTDPEVVAVLERELREQASVLGDAKAVRIKIRAAWGRPGDSLVEDAEAEHADLLVVGTHQHHGWRRLQRGFSTLGTLRAAHIPVLTIPAGHGTSGPSTAAVPSIRSVLVATDLSDLANAAVPAAYALVRGSRGTVELCHVHERFVPTPGYGGVPEGKPLDAGERAAVEARLRALVPAEADTLGITTHVTVIEGGQAAEAIVQAGHRLGVDVIVMSSHGRSGVARALVGSVAEAVMRSWDRPLHVVRRRND